MTNTIIDSLINDDVKYIAFMHAKIHDEYGNDVMMYGAKLDDTIVIISSHFQQEIGEEMKDYYPVIRRLPIYLNVDRVHSARIISTEKFVKFN